MAEWIKCSDKEPEFEGDYLTYIIDNGCSYRFDVQRFYTVPRILQDGSKTCWELTTWDDHICTHWMPLPQPPKENE